MEGRDVGRARDRLTQLDRRANESLGTFDAGSIGIGRYVAGRSPWERHRNGDELLLVTDGQVQIEVLEDDGAPHVELLTEGSLFVVPRGRWHQLTASAGVNILYISPSEEGAERTRDRPVVGGDAS